MIPILRDYQQQIEDKIYEKWQQKSLRYPTNKRRLVVQLSTGGGKTVIFSDMARKAHLKGSNVLIITHREELLDQTSGTLIDFELHPSIVTRASKRPPKGDLTVAMTGTLSRRIHKVEWQEWFKKIDLIILDECHEQHFNWLFDNPLSNHKYILGFTATPSRSGKQRQLGQDYEDMVIGVDTQELINMGYLVTDKYFSVPVDVDGVSKKGGEYNSDEMYNRFNKTELYAGVVSNWIRLWNDTITIVFCCNIQHCIETCKAFNEAGIKAKFIVSKLAKPKPLRENATKEDIVKHDIKTKEYANYKENFTKFSGSRHEVVDEWKRGEYKILINAGIATTGFDFRPIQTVIMNRVTTSSNLLQQIMGRGSRILNKKERAIYGNKTFFNFGDFGENCERLKCYYRQQHEYSLFHEESKSGKGAPAYKECPKCHALVTVSSTVCKYCGFIFPKSRKQEIVELKEVKYADAMQSLKTMEDYDLYAAATGKKKQWVFRMIFIRWGKDGLIKYAKKHHYAYSWVMVVMKRYQAQGIRPLEK